MKKIILPFYFKKISSERYLISNMLRKFHFVNAEQFKNLYLGNVDKISAELAEKKFIINEDELELVAEEYRNLNAGLFRGATLHIFVLTLNCNLKCLYCQAEFESNQSAAMNFEVAEKAVDFALNSPEKILSFEFQGGEPLLNFSVLKHIVEYTKNHRGSKQINFSLVTNAQAMTFEILEFLLKNNINISYSLDGRKNIHDLNRPTKDGTSNFEKVLFWYRKSVELFDALKSKSHLSLQPTITKHTLKYPREFVDFFVELKSPYISIRNLSPFGRIQKNSDINYTAEEFLNFYRECMDYLTDLNLFGETDICESFSEIILQKIFGKHAVNYPDLRSPCGAVCGQIAYNWNGDIFTCDEGRMLANIGVNNFRVGNVFEDNYKSCIESENACATCNASCLESISECENCVHNPICGVCSVYSFFMQNDYIGVPIKQERCKILRGTFDYLIEKINCGGDVGKIYERWGK